MEVVSLIIGLTGGIASGKSTVSSMLVELGASLVDADRLAREVVLPGTPTLQAVIDAFGQAIVADDGSLDRKKLGEIVFADESARKRLESILHPAIRELMKERMNKLESDHPKGLVVVDVPLMYESSLASMFDEVMLVYVPANVQLERLMKRDGLSREQAQARLRAQMPIEQKREMADWIIDNSKGIEQTKAQVRQFWIGKGLA